MHDGTRTQQRLTVVKRMRGSGAGGGTPVRGTLFHEDVHLEELEEEEDEEEEKKMRRKEANGPEGGGEELKGKMNPIGDGEADLLNFGGGTVRRIKGWMIGVKSVGSEGKEVEAEGRRKRRG